MICPKCKNEIPDDAKFCTKCGEKIEKEQIDWKNTNFELGKDKENLECPYCHTKLVENAKFCVNCGHSINEDEYKGDRTKKKTSRNKFVIGGIVILFIVVGTGIYMLGNSKNGLLFSGETDTENKFNSTSEKQSEVIKNINDVETEVVETEDNAVYMYVANGRYMLVNDINKNEAIDLGNSYTEDMDSDLVTFTDNGKYVYFFTQYESSTESGTLCRAEIKKLKVESEENNNYIEIIDNNVNTGIQLLKDDRVVYRKEDGTLYYYNGSATIEISSNIEVNAYRVDTENGRVVYEKKDDEGNALYAGTVGESVEIKKIVSNIDYLGYFSDEGTVFYTIPSEQNGKDNLYVINQDVEGQKIADNITVVSMNPNEYYYTVDNGETLNLCDYIKNLEGTYQVKNLYCYKNGELKLIADNVLNAGGMSDSDYIVYNTVDMIDELLCGKELSSMSDVLDALYVDYSMENYFYHKENGNIIRCSKKAAEKLGEMYNTDDVNGFLNKPIVRGTESKMYISADNFGFYEADIKNGVVQEFKIIDENGSNNILHLDEDVIYYSANAYEVNEREYCDLYTYKAGKSVCVARDIYPYFVKMYDDNTVWAYTDYDSDEVSVFSENGGSEILADGVTGYVKLSETKVLFESNGVLYMYDGGEKKRINEVEEFWSKTPVQVKIFN